MNIYKSKYPDLLIPKITLPRLILGDDDNDGIQHSLIEDDDDTRICLIDGDDELGIRRLTRGDVKRRSSECAAALAATFNDCKGIVVCICTPNCIEYSFLVLGSLKAGVIVTMTNPRLMKKEMVAQWRDARVRLVFCMKDSLEHVQIASKDVNGLELIVLIDSVIGDLCIDDGEERAATAFARVVSYQQFLASIDYHEQQHDDNDERRLNNRIESPDQYLSTAIMPYSSGTTGVQKGVCLSHRNLVANTLQFRAIDASDVHSNDVYCAFLPFFHIYGLMVILLYGLYARIPIVVLRRYSLLHLLASIDRFHVTFLHVVPPVLVDITKLSEEERHRFSLKSLRVLFSGAAPLTSSLVDAVAHRLQPLAIVIRQGYGMTELSPTSHMSPPLSILYSAKEQQHQHDSTTINSVVSVGVLVPNMQCKIDSETNEILVKGPNVFDGGYLHCTDATAAAFDASGWLRTGDVGLVDADGYLFITGRLKELIKYKGMHVAPAEVENVLIEHNHVHDAVVVGVEDDEAGELPRAFVVLTNRAFELYCKQDDPDQLLMKQLIESIHEFLNERVASYKRLRGGIEVVQSIPKSPAGKKLRRLLKKIK